MAYLSGDPTPLHPEVPTMDAPLLELPDRPLWSATPTPLLGDARRPEHLEIDIEATHRLVDHHLRVGCDGLFILGSCGEGPWLPRALHRVFIREVCAHNAGRLTIGAQVTDNSAPRILENMAMAAEEGADVAIMAAPFKLMGPLATTKMIDLYLDAIEGSPLPVGIYDLGERDKTFVPGDVLAEVLTHPKVIALKDSSGDAARREVALQVRAGRPAMRIMSGNEFDTVSYLAAGYDGLVLGGAIFNGALTRQIMAAVDAHDLERAEALQERMNALMYDVYGGEAISCWLAGLKHLLVRMGLFSTTINLLGYDLSDECAARIEQALVRDRDVLFPED